MKPGETFTIGGVWTTERNPERRWWQFWKPRWVTNTDRLQTFTVVGDGGMIKIKRPPEFRR